MVKSKKLCNTRVKQILRTSVLFSLIFSLNISNLTAQDSGPSLENLKRNASETTKEMEKIKAEERQKEIMSYIYMSLGFAVVIGIAWFTTVAAKKKSLKEQEERMRFILKQQELKKHHGHAHGHHAHGHLHRVKR
jgi:hypothetical protein